MISLLKVNYVMSITHVVQLYHIVQMIVEQITPIVVHILNINNMHMIMMLKKLNVCAKIIYLTTVSLNLKVCVQNNKQNLLIKHILVMEYQ